MLHLHHCFFWLSFSSLSMSISASHKTATTTQLAPKWAWKQQSCIFKDWPFFGSLPISARPSCCNSSSSIVDVVVGIFFVVLCSESFFAYKSQRTVLMTIVIFALLRSSIRSLVSFAHFLATPHFVMTCHIQVWIWNENRCLHPIQINPTCEKT